MDKHVGIGEQINVEKGNVGFSDLRLNGQTVVSVVNGQRVQVVNCQSTRAEVISGIEATKSDGKTGVGAVMPCIPCLQPWKILIWENHFRLPLGDNEICDS